MRSKELQGLTVKALLVIAKTHQLIGRHSMKKDELINSIIRCEAKVPTESTSRSSNMEEVTIRDVKVFKDARSIVDHIPKLKSDYITNLKVGTLIAFKVNDTKLLSGIVEVICGSNLFKVKTKTGVKFTVAKTNIAWVKTGERWPRGVYQALKGEVPDVLKEKDRANN